MRKNTIIKLLLILLSLLVSTVAIEIGLNIFYSKQLNGNPNLEPYESTENIQHFRGVKSDIIYKPNPEIYSRIICLGDSFTYGHGVANDKTYPYILEKYLCNNLGKKVEVINAGVCGSTINEQLLMYNDSCSKLEHDIVLLLFSDSDIRDSAIIKLYNSKPIPRAAPALKIISIIRRLRDTLRTNKTEKYLNNNEPLLIYEYIRYLKELNIQ